MGQTPGKRRPPKNSGPQPGDRLADGQPRRASDGYALLALCVFLLLAVLMVFGQTVNHQFVNFDDDAYLLENEDLPDGLTPKGIAWAFTTFACHNWHPVTWLSYMIDYQLYGLNPSVYHLHNVLLHAATAILLLLVLRRMTGDLWPSAFVAAVFAVHPLRAESVAWAAERKDVLSGLFFMLTLAAYVAYVRRPFSLGRYLLVIGLFALGLMAKPMLVTLPFVLLLLDYWPLERMALRWRLLVEKLPLLALSAASCTITSVAQASVIKQLDAISVSTRISNALVSYAVYVKQLFYPVGLAVGYPHPGNGLPGWQVAGASLLLASVSLGVFAWRRRCPYLLVGWCWYLGMLVPVIGLVQVGFQAMADRYTYLPQIGLLIGLTWAAKQVVQPWPNRVWLCGAAATLILATLMGCATRQTSYWRTAETLWRRTIAATSPNAIAHYNMGDILDKRERPDEAMAEYRKALEIDPNDASSHTNLAIDLAGKGRSDEAIAHFREALKITPDQAEIHYNLSLSLIKKRQFDEAIVHLRKALETLPDFAEAHNSLGLALDRTAHVNDAIVEYHKALEINPNLAEARGNLTKAMKQRERAK